MEILTKIDETLHLLIRKVMKMLASRYKSMFSRVPGTRRILIGLPVVSALFFAGFADSAKAFPFSHKKAAPAATSPAPSPAARASVPTAAPAALPSPRPNAASPVDDGSPAQAPAVIEVPATPAERLAARSLDLVSQSRFWLDELRKRPTDTEAAYEASIALRAIGSPDRAVQTAAMGIQTKPDEPRLWSALAMGLVADNQNEVALQAMQKAISLSPRDARLHNSLGVIYDRLETPVLAQAAYQSALALAPGDSSILSNYGISVAMAGDLPRAETLLRQAVQNPIAPPQARQNLALVVGLQGRFSESEQLASRDLPAATATENVGYLRRMLNGGDSRWSQAATAGN
jgi:Flp pilus assembly protein TadD